MNSGYKAWEYQQYLFGLGPTLFRTLLPEKYWLNFCKLVSGVRLLQRHHISCEELVWGHQILMEFVCEFEDLYYQRKASRIHFVRQSIHMLTHMAPETIHAGPLSCYAQWTLETAIGNLGREIRQDRDIYTNLTQRAVLRAQLNSVRARFPQVQLEFGDPLSLFVSGNARTFDGYDGYVLLPRREVHPTLLEEDELEALTDYWRLQGWPMQDSWPNAVCRWAKLQLPNGQKARSIWFESTVTTSVRQASCVEVGIVFVLFITVYLDSGQIEHMSCMRIADVMFYFFMRFGESQFPLAMVSLFSAPDEGILLASSGTVYLCDPLQGLVVIPISSVRSVVAMFPEMVINEEGKVERTGKFSLMRHAYIELAKYSPEGFANEGEEGEDSVELE